MKIHSPRPERPTNRRSLNLATWFFISAVQLRSSAQKFSSLPARMVTGVPSGTSPSATTLNATGSVLLDRQWVGKTVHTTCGQPVRTSSPGCSASRLSSVRSASTSALRKPSRVLIASDRCMRPGSRTAAGRAENRYRITVGSVRETPTDRGGGRRMCSAAACKNATCVSSGTGGPARLTVKKAFFHFTLFFLSFFPPFPYFFVRGRFVGRRLRPLRSFGLPPLAVNGGGPAVRCSPWAEFVVCTPCVCSAEDRRARVGGVPVASVARR